jgi:hypothetical protein
MGIARRVTRAALRGAGRDLIAVVPGGCRGAAPMARRVPVTRCGPRDGEYQQGR